METVFLHFARISMSAGWAILAVLLFRFILREAPKWTHCLLWGMVGLRLMVPVFIPNPIRLPAVLALRDSVEGAVLQLTAADTSSKNATSYLSVFSWIWLGGLLLLLAYGGISYLLVYRRVRVSAKYAEQIYLCDDITTPFILGVFRPRICLPSGIEAEQVSYVVRHERAHLQRKDHLWKPLSFLLLAVYWFHPLIWLAYVILNRDIELACDEKSIRDMAAPDKKRYSEALVSCSIQRRKLLVCPVGFGELNVRERIGSVFSYRKSTRWHTVLAVALCVPLSLCFLTESAAGASTTIADTVDESSEEMEVCCPYYAEYGTEEEFSMLEERRTIVQDCPNSADPRGVIPESHTHIYGSVYAAVKCRICADVKTGYYVGKSEWCPYEENWHRQNG